MVPKLLDYTYNIVKIMDWVGVLLGCRDGQKSAGVVYSEDILGDKGRELEIWVDVTYGWARR